MSTKETEAALVTLSFVELYQNAFRTLLPPLGATAASQFIDAREAPDGTVFLSGPPGLHVPVTSAAAALALVRQGHAARATAGTACNTQSSRSHAILTIRVEARGAGGGPVRIGKLNFVDLAGSER